VSIRLLFVRVMRRFNFRVFCWVFFGALALTTVLERLMPRVYESAGAIQLLRSGPRVFNEVESFLYELPLSEKLPASEDIELGNIVRRMSAEDRSALLRPYGYDSNASGAVVEKVLKDNFRITPKRLSLIVIISYRHPTPEVALKMADLFMEECLASHFRLREQEISRAVEELDIRCKRQALTVKEMEKELENAKTHQSLDDEAYERRLKINRELLANMSMRRKEQASELVTSPLRVVDHPVLPKADDYVRFPVIGFFRWRLALSASVGLLAALIIRRKTTVN
jgi:hypothetical protein